MYEYQDYLASPTKGNASEFITRCIEENLDQIDKRENYVQYIAKRPRVERFGTHGLFTNADVPINLPQVAQEVAEHDGVVMTQILSLRREDAARLGYDLWYEQRDKVVQMYQTDVDDRVPLSQNKTFHPIRNVVVTEALKLSLENSVFEEVAEEKLPEKEDVPPVVQNEDPGETGSEASVAKQLAEKLEKESTAADESSQDSRWQFANRNRSNPYLALTCARLVANIAQIIQEDIEKEQKQLNLIDRKLRRKIAEKKQLHGQRMG